MTERFNSYLFDKGYLIHEEGASSEKASDVVLALLTLFGLRVTEGFFLADEKMIPFAAEQLGIHVPLPFYRGFPESVRALSPDVLLFDQLYHYANTYGFGNFDEAGHSIFESYVERSAMKESLTVREYKIVTEKEALEILKDFVKALLSSTRPLNDRQLELCMTYSEEYGLPCKIASHNTAIRLLFETSDTRYADSLVLSDVIKFCEYLNYRVNHERHIRKLNLRNVHRRLITAVLDRMFESGVCNIRDCYEKKALWCGLLHHIHYQPKNELARRFLEAMRSKGNESVYSAFEKAMLESDVKKAAEILKEGKGSGAVLRNLHYLISRAKTFDEVEAILSMISTKNAILLLQLLIRYGTYHDEGARTFKFVRFNLMTIHNETAKEARERKSLLQPLMIDLLKRHLLTELKACLKNRVGKVYIEDGMDRYAVPIQEGTTNTGFGVLPRGSRIAIPEDKKIRAFVYWEKVNDIDLSMIGLDHNGKQYEFSWRSMAFLQSKAVTFSGDETSGYDGGSEYFDLDPEAFLKEHPHIETLIFNANVYSGTPFSENRCRAGYMTRDILDSGEIYEPKTVQSAFSVNCDSTMAHLFALDLKTREFVWLNTGVESNQTVAGEASLAYLTPYFDILKVVNFKSFFEMMATELVGAFEEADLVIGEKEYTLKEGAEQISPRDYEKVFRYLS